MLHLKFLLSSLFYSGHGASEEHTLIVGLIMCSSSESWNCRPDR